MALLGVSLSLAISVHHVKVEVVLPRMTALSLFSSAIQYKDPSRNEPQPVNLGNQAYKKCSVKVPD